MIIIVAPFVILPTEGRSSRFHLLARELSANGYPSTIITSKFYHQGKTKRHYSYHEIDQVQYIFVDEPGYTKNVSPARFISNLNLSIRLSISIVARLFIYNKTDMIYCAYPLALPCLTSLLASKIKKIPFIIDIQDIWPQAMSDFVPSGFKFLITILTLPTRIAAEASILFADLVFSVSRRYTERWSFRIPDSKLRIFYLGSDALSLPKKNTQDPFNSSYSQPCITVGYLGNLGASFDFTPLLQAVNKSRGIRALLIGEGTKKYELETLIQANNLNATITGWLSYDAALERAAICDFLIYPICLGGSQSISNKLCDYISLGKPILSSIPIEKLPFEHAPIYQYKDADDICQIVLNQPARKKVLRVNANIALATRSPESSIFYHMSREYIAERMSDSIIELLA